MYMRIKIFILLFIVTYACSKKENTQQTPAKFTEIDRIYNLRELRQFIQKSDSSLTNFLCRSPKFYGQNKRNEYVSKMKQKVDSMFSDFTFIKEDLDSNGYTDLVITGEYYLNSLDVLAIMNHGSKNYSIIPLTLNSYDFPIYPKIAYKNKVPVIELYSGNFSTKNSESDIAKQTLVYKFGIFIEYTEPSEEYEISKIEFNTSGCHGACPIFDLTLNENSISKFTAKHYNFSKKPIVYGQSEEGKFETVIHKKEYDEICQIINYLQIKTLDDSYFLFKMHQPSCKLSVHFTDGSIKTIDDYGKVGTNGLNFLYKKLHELRFNQDWKKISKENL